MYIFIYILYIFIYLCYVNQKNTIMKSLQMLPHVWQKVGRTLLVLCLVVFAVFFKAVVHDLLWFDTKWYNAFGHGWAYLLVVLFFLLGIVLLAISKERAEDERVTFIRHQALIRTVILYLVIALINLFLNLFITSWIGPEKASQVMVIKRYFTCVPAFILYYVLIFKVSLWWDNKKTDDEE